MATEAAEHSALTLKPVTQDGLSGLEAKVAFLMRPESYPVRSQSIEPVETHMAWVFLTDEHAWKLKKPVRTQYLDFSTVEQRRRDCRREVRLNRRLAPDVYLGTVALAVDSRGGLHFNENGRVVDWLVQMRRLPRKRMLDEVLRRGDLTEGDVRPAAEWLASFYRQAPPAGWSGEHYRRRIAAAIEENRQDLGDSRYELPDGTRDSAAAVQQNFLRQRATLFDERTDSGRVIEAHGDLRPEHICLTEPPAIIDCLEFNRDLRILDIASELTFLGLECERLGAAWVGDLFLETWCRESGDRPRPELLDFYRSWHAVTRARIALWHLRDGVVQQPEKWRSRAREYLDIARRSLA